MSYYVIYETDKAPKELTDRHPHAATYADGMVTLFVNSIEDITGLPPEKSIDLSVRGFNNPYDDNTPGLTASELDSLIDEFVLTIKSGNAVGAEIRISKEQGRYLYMSRFKPEESDLI